MIMEADRKESPLRLPAARAIILRSPTDQRRTKQDRPLRTQKSRWSQRIRSPGADPLTRHCFNRASFTS